MLSLLLLISCPVICTVICAVLAVLAAILLAVVAALVLVDSVEYYAEQRAAGSLELPYGFSDYALRSGSCANAEYGSVAEVSYSLSVRYQAERRRIYEYVSVALCKAVEQHHESV